ncbi:MAG: NUDIX domain-containing protein [Leifsonia sp.]
MTLRSAGILLHRRRSGAGTDGRGTEVLIAHMGGPYWEKKDAHGWSIPKGLIEPDEADLDAALREFEEELGIAPPPVEYRRLGEFRVTSAKMLTVFAGAADVEVTVLTSSTFEVEWPPHSGRMQTYPEMDAAGWFDLATAREKLVRGQAKVLDALEEALDEDV